MFSVRSGLTRAVSQTSWVLVLVATSSFTAAPAAGGTGGSVIATEAGLTTVDAYRGRLVWTSYDPRIRRYRLMTHAQGVTSVARVRSRGIPFDVDLAPDVRGRTVAVYSRCRREPSDGPIGPAGCDLYRYDFAARREARIDAVSSRRLSESEPSIWRNKIAFVRASEPPPGGGETTARLLVHDLRADRTDRVRTHPQRDARPLAIELYGRHLGFISQLDVTRCGALDEIDLRSYLWLARTDSRAAPRLVESACQGLPAQRVATPSFDRGGLFHYRLANGDPTDGARQLRRVGLRRRSVTAAPIPFELPVAVVRDGGSTFYSRDTELGSADSTEIGEAHGLRFTPVASR